MNITIPGGSTKRLLTAGKYCLSDILVTAEGSASRLPDGYTELEYIESTGTQYIDTGVTGGTNASFEMTARLVSTNSRNNNQMFGTIKNFCSVNGTSSAMRVEDANGTMYQFSSKPMEKWTVRVDSDGKIYCNGVYVNTSSVTKGRGWGGTTYGNWLFYTSDDGINFATSLELYSLKMYTNGDLVRDYVPCRSPYGDVGLYDLVTKTFYCNAGTGSFVAGVVPRKLPEGYTQVEYIQSSGTQYIDTGFKPNNNTRVVMDAQMSSTSTAHFYFGSRGTGATISYDLLWTNGNIRSDYGESKLTFSGVDATSRLVIDKNKNVCSVNGVSVTNTASTFQLGYSLYLFASHDYGSAKYHGTVKVYSCQIYDNGTLVRDFVPCKNPSGVFGLYDMANAQFYDNAGSGSFTGA